LTTINPTETVTMRILKAAFPAVVLLASVAGIQAQTVQTTINYPLGVTGVAVDYVADRAYVLLPTYNADGTNAVQVLDTRSNAVIATYTVPVASAIAVNVITGKLYVAGTVASTVNASGIEAEVVELNQKTGAVLATIPVSANAGLGITSIVADPLHYTVYAANATDNAITVISSKSNTVTASLDLAGQTPNTVAMNAFTGTMYATLNDNQVAIYNPYTKVLKYVVYGSQTSGIAVDPIRNLEYVTDGVFDVPSVGVLSSKGVTKATVSVGLFPQGVDVDFVTDKVYVANEADGTISVLDGDGDSVTTTIPTAANTISVNPAEAKFYAVGSTSITIFSE
jgi:YVTN family beta-propeller protein